MRPSRLLPPQFLLPAWSAGQLRQHARVLISCRPYSEWNSFRPPNEPRRRNPLSQPAQNPKISLFEELFPKEAKRAQKPHNGSLSDRAWDADANELDERGAAKVAGTADGLIMEESATTIHTREPEGPRESEGAARKSVRDRRPRTPRDQLPQHVLVLASASKALDESDFFRLSPRGQHIDGWANGIVKVIPARHGLSLAHQGMYYIVFSNEFAARNYGMRVRELHKLTRKHTPHNILSPPPPPRGFARSGGEDVSALLHIFTLIPAAKANANIRLLKADELAAAQKIIDAGGVMARVQGRDLDAEPRAMRVGGRHRVVVTIDNPAVSLADLRAAIERDGIARNLPWQLASAGSTSAAEAEALVQIISNRGLRRQQQLQQQQQKLLSRGSHEAVRDEERPDKWQMLPARFIVSLRDRHEAQRFVRAWHRRPFLAGDDEVVDEAYAPMVTAEVLW